MSQDFHFDASQYTPSTGQMDAIPAGWYNMMIEESEIKATNDGLGAYIEFRFSVADGKHKGAKAWARLNIKNANEKAMEIAYGDLTAICVAVNHMQMKQTCELHNRPLKCKLNLVPAKGEYAAKNDIKAYRDINYEPPLAPASANPLAGAQAPVGNAAPPMNQPPAQTNIPPQQNQAPVQQVVQQQPAQTMQQQPVQQAPVQQQAVQQNQAPVQQNAPVQQVVQQNAPVQTNQAPVQTNQAPQQTWTQPADQPWEGQQAPANNAPVQQNQAPAQTAPQQVVQQTAPVQQVNTAVQQQAPVQQNEAPAWSQNGAPQQ